GVHNQLLDDPVLVKIGSRLGATPAQVALAWLLNQAPNVLLIPGTRTRRHLAENIAAGAVTLDDDARTALTQAFPPDRSRWPPAGRRGRTSPARPAAPTSCDAMNPTIDPGAMPAKLLLNARPIVTAGLANAVEDVNQYAAPM